jgi:hypothetical protein
MVPALACVIFLLDKDLCTITYKDLEAVFNQLKPIFVILVIKCNNVNILQVLLSNGSQSFINGRKPALRTLLY